ncbi:MAG TPA: hypothetical protein V6D19_19940 [Stenomitos sp.]
MSTWIGVSLRFLFGWIGFVANGVEVEGLDAIAHPSLSESSSPIKQRCLVNTNTAETQ